MIGSARGAVLLATHAALRNRWEDVQRLAFQGYSAFMLDWRKAPILAVSHRHELLSSLPLLYCTECFTSCQQLDLQQDRFTAWVDSLFIKLVVAASRKDRLEPLYNFILFYLGRFVLSWVDHVPRGTLLQRLIQTWDDALGRSDARKLRPISCTVALRRVMWPYFGSPFWNLRDVDPPRRNQWICDGTTAACDWMDRSQDWHSMDGAHEW